ncbi:MAG TPA: hypothetical protein VLF94_06700 [Chlamydiales bacterium]|nr:hypothetical protein [Chlamydiales bacterium]
MKRSLFHCLLLFGPLYSAQEAPSCAPILHYIHDHLSCCGTLKNSSGFVYVDVDDGYIHELIPFIQEEGFEEPPYFGRSDLVGAHITVIYPEEMKKYNIQSIKECGTSIQFTPRACQVVHPPRQKETDGVYFIVVDAPQLDDLRKQYGLPKREYDFHITIGVKPKAIKSA